MKKTLTRVLSLVLVLVMMLGIVPVASAAYPEAPATPTISGAPTSAKVGDTLNLSASLTWRSDEQANWYRTPTLTWNIGGTSKTGANVTYTVTAADLEAGTLSISVTASFTHASHAQQYPNYETSSATASVTIADEYTISIPETLTLRPGTNGTLTAAVTKNGVADSTATVTWSSNNSKVVVSGGLVAAAADASGTATITAAIMDGSTVLASDTCDVTIQEAYSVTVSPATKTAKAGDTVTFTATVKDADKNTITPTSGALTWSSNNAKVVSQGNGRFAIAADATGNATITAKYTKDSKDYTGTATLTIDDGAYVVTVDPDTLALALGGEEQLTAAVATKDGAAVTPASGELTWHTSDATVATVAAGKVTASTTKSGTATITAKYTKNDKEYIGICEVTVASGKISCDNYSVAASTTNSHQLAPLYDTNNDGKTEDGVTFRYTKVSGDATVNDSGKVTASGVSYTQIKIEALSGSTVLDTKNVYVCFYDYNTIEVTMPKDATELVFGDYTDLYDEYQSLAVKMLKNIVGANETSDRVYFDTSYDLTGVIGKISGYTAGTSYKIAKDLGNMEFNVTGGQGGEYRFTYKVTKSFDTKLVILAGSVTINFDGKAGSIEYSTTYDKAVTFAEADFYKVWAAAKKTSKLDYVTFTLPTSGTLYTSTTSTSTAYKATKDHRFYYGNYTSGTNNKDLGSLTYVPVYTKLTTYDVSIPFIAYGETDSETMYGTVVIHLNEKSNAITPRGIFFGTVYDNNGTTTVLDDKTYADQMADIFYEKTNKVLDSVIFTLPVAEKATLYSRVPTNAAGNTLVAQGTKLLATNRLTVGSSLTGGIANAQLKNVALVPAAGFSGQLTLTFTGFASGESTGTECSITFDVKSKTASAVFSDVTAKYYSSASASVDFLYYEGTAQGSNGKYNPAANITRQDFMLMLYRAFLAEDYGTFTPTSNFPDVVKGNTAYSQEIYQAVGVAKYLGIAQGTNNKFNPKSNITRQEAMVLIYRTLETINKDLRTASGVKVTSMKDYAKISSWATTAISNLVAHGVIKGNNDYIKPMDPISRAEMAAILHRVITY